MRRQGSAVAQGRVLHLDYESERRTGCGGSGARPRSPDSSCPGESERRTGCGGSGAVQAARSLASVSARRDGEQEAEAVEPEGVAVPIERDHAGRNGEQDAEAVELVEVGQRIGGALQSERRTGCGGSGAIDPTSSTAGPKQSERRTGCGGSGAGSMTSGRRTRRVVGTENRMRRQWSDTYFGLCRQAAEVGTENRMRRQWSCSSGTLVGQCVRASERRTGCGGSGAARYGRSIGHPGLVGTENRMRRQWSRRASANAAEVRCSRNGEQDAEAVERSTRRLRRRARSSRNGEQDAEAVELGRWPRAGGAEGVG